MSDAVAGRLLGMDQLTVRPCTVADLAESPEFGALADEYAAESGRAITEGHNPQIEFYRQAEAAGNMLFAGAWLGDELVGILVLHISVVPHFGKTIASTESLFVASHARESGAGSALLEQAEGIARDAGAVGLVVSAPVGGRLSRILPRSGFRHTNELFFKGLT